MRMMMKKYVNARATATRRLRGMGDEQHRGDEPQHAGQPLASLVNGTDSLQTEIRGAVRGEKHGGKHRHGQRVPIEDADAASRSEVGEQRHAEMPLPSIGTPLITFPSAVPNGIASRTFEAANTKSQPDRQTESLM